jgi:RHS repeat-associated protein
MTPPAGGTPTITLDDANGRTRQLQQFNSATATGTLATVTNYTYTPTGKIASTTDSAGNTSTYTYDLLDRVTNQSDPDGGLTATSYDANGNTLSTTDARGKTISNTFDADNREIFSYDTTGGAAQNSSTEIAAWVFDTKKTGYPTSVTSIYNGASFTHATLGYNGFAEPTGDETIIPTATITGALAGTYVRSFSYDSYTGLPLSQTDQAAGGLAQETISYGYDAYGRALNVAGTNTYVNKLAYTEFDQPSQYTFGTSGTFTQLTLGYDEQTQALTTALTTASTASAAIDSTTYRYDNAQLLTQVDSTQGETGSPVTNDQCFAYNNLTQLTSAWTPPTSGTNACATAPTTANAASTIGGYRPYWQSWTFDNGGNRTTQTTHDVTGNTAADVATGYTYPAAGSSTDQPNTMRTATTTTGSTTATISYGYDQAGDTTTVTAPTGTQTLQWNDQGHLASDTSGGGTTSYVYDATGSLLLQQDPGSTTLYLADEQLVLTGSTVTGSRFYRLGTTQVAVRSADGHVAYLIPDRHGSDVLQIDATAQTAVRESYTPYGSLRGSAPANWIGAKSYVGGTSDAATGLINLGAREYDPTTGRFLSLDQVMEGASPQQMNGYAYAGNDPTTDSDPTGTMSICGGPCLINPGNPYVVNQTPGAYKPPATPPNWPATDPDYGVVEWDVTFNVPLDIPVFRPVPILNFYKGAAERPHPKKIYSSLLNGQSCSLFLLGAGAASACGGGYGTQISPAKPEKPWLQNQYWSTTTSQNQLVTKRVIISVTISFSVIIARNGHVFKSVGIGTGAPLPDDTGVEQSVSARWGFFGSHVPDDQTDSYLVGKYVAVSGTAGPLVASVSKSFPGGWAFEVGSFQSTGGQPPLSGGISGGCTVPFASNFNSCH